MFVPREIASHHIVAGTLGILAGLFHLSVRPPQHLYSIRMSNIEPTGARPSGQALSAAPHVPSSIPRWDEFRNRLVGGCVCASVPLHSLCRLGKKSPSLLGQGSGGFSVGD